MSAQQVSFPGLIFSQKWVPYHFWYDIRGQEGFTFGFKNDPKLEPKMDRNLVQKWARIGSKNDPGLGPKVDRIPHRFWNGFRSIFDPKADSK